MMVYHYWPFPAGGAESQCRKLTHQLTAEGCACWVLAARLSRAAPSKENDHGVQIRRLFVLDPLFRWVRKKEAGTEGTAVGKARSSTSGKQSATLCLHLINRLIPFLNAWLLMLQSSVWLWRHRHEYDILHVHSMGWMGAFAGLIGHRLGKTVLCKESTDPTMRPSEAKVLPASWITRGIGHCRIVVQTPAAYEYWHNAGIPEQRLLNVTNGVVIPPERKFPQKRPTILWVGNFTQGVETKGLDLLMKIWENLCRQHEQVRLVMAGNGEPSVLSHLTQDQEALQRIDFTGFLDDTRSVYEQAWVFVLPSRREGLSNALLEAQSWGIPAVVSDIPGNRAVVQQGASGFLVELGKPDQFTNRILQLLQDPVLRKQMGVDAKDYICNTFSMEKTAGNWISIYKETMSNDRSF
jgi:glycosyltransferase involved in cell wall biosynthesis